MDAKSQRERAGREARPTVDVPGHGWLTPDEPEWAYAWGAFPDPVLAHPVSGERLQYLGSTQEAERGWVHVLRHRQLPTTQQRTYWQVPATPGWALQRSQQAEDDCRPHERPARPLESDQARGTDV